MKIDLKINIMNRNVFTNKYLYIYIYMKACKLAFYFKSILGPGALLPLVSLMAFSISWHVIGPLSIANSSFTSIAGAGSSGSGLLRTVRKCSFHLSHCSSSFVIGLPSLLWMYEVVLKPEPVNSFVTL